MFSFAKNIVKSLEQSAETIINTSTNYINTENDPYFQSAESQFGFRILYIKPDSIGAKLGLETWFDYIVGINGHELLFEMGDNNKIPSYDYFIKEIENCVNQPITLNVWNAKGGILRQISIEKVEPFNTNDKTIYNQQGYLVDSNQVVINNKFNTLGLTIQATPLITATYVYHVLEIQPSSPAESCGLLAHSDYIIGAQDGMFATGGEDLFARVINSVFNRSPNNCEIELIVYNHDFDVVRPVIIRPSNQWQGTGILGCGVGYGFLHRLPEVVGKFENTLSVSGNNFNNHYLQPPGETLFQNIENNSTEFIPAGPPPMFKAATPEPSVTINQMAPPPASLNSNRRKKKHVDVSTFDDYFKEETEKSEKLDHRPTTVNSDGAKLPPPPKLS